MTQICHECYAEPEHHCYKRYKSKPSVMGRCDYCNSRAQLIFTAEPWSDKVRHRLMLTDFLTQSRRFWWRLFDGYYADRH